MTTKDNRGKAPAFQFYASDFLSDTCTMTNVEKGVYITLLSMQWVNGGLPSDHDRLANAVGSDLHTVWDAIKHKFELGEDGQYRNPKLEGVRQQQSDFVKRQSDAGKIGAAKRWHKDDDSKAIATPLGSPIPKHSSSTSTSTSTSTSSKDQNIRPFHPPTVNEVNVYCVERGNNVRPQDFIDYYESVGWVVGKNKKMKCWKSAVRQWESRDKQHQQGDMPTLKKGEYL